MGSNGLTHRVTIEEATYTKDMSGQRVASWSDLYTDVPAEVMPKSGRERLRDDQVIGTTDYTVRIGYLSDIHLDQRILWADRGTTRTLNIEEVSTGSTAFTGRRELMLGCSEVTTDTA